MTCPIRNAPPEKRIDRSCASYWKRKGLFLASALLTEVLGILDSLSIKEINQYPVLCNPGVPAALEMASSAGWVNGLLTGNTPVRARAKLESASIWSAFDSDFAYFGNEALSRGALVASSVRAIRSEGCSVVRVVIGDTPLDIRSAKEHELQVVAVATGPTLRQN